MKIAPIDLIYMMMNTAKKCDETQTTLQLIAVVDDVLTELSSAFPVVTLRLALATEKALTLRAERQMLREEIQSLTPPF